MRYFLGIILTIFLSTKTETVDVQAQASEKIKLQICVIDSPAQQWQEGKDIASILKKDFSFTEQFDVSIKSIDQKPT